MLYVTAVAQSALQPKAKAFVLSFQEVGTPDIPLVGGKNASLGETLHQLCSKRINVPDGFATTAYAYRYFIEVAGLEKKLRRLFAELGKDVLSLGQVGKQAHQATSLSLRSSWWSKGVSANCF